MILSAEPACAPDPATAPGRICGEPIPSFMPDGRLADLAAPRAGMIDFTDVAARLSRIARFTGAGQGSGRGLPISVAQHSVMGAQALLAEGETALTAGLYLLHDAHEYAIGDFATPVTNLIVATMREGGDTGDAFLDAIARIKSAWDDAIYAAANLPPPWAWNRRTAAVIKRMDARMMAAEAEALFGPAARKALPVSRYPAPRVRAVIEPWGTMKAEAEFLVQLRRFVWPHGSAQS